MFQLIISVFVVFFSLAANAKPEYQPEVLEEVLQRVSETKNPVVIFDIDDTITGE